MKKNGWLSLAFTAYALAGCGHGPLPPVAALPIQPATAPPKPGNIRLMEENVCTPENFEEGLAERGWSLWRFDGAGRDEQKRIYIDFVAQKNITTALGHATCDVKQLNPIEIRLYDASTHARI